MKWFTVRRTGLLMKLLPQKLIRDGVLEEAVEAHVVG